MPDPTVTSPSPSAQPASSTPPGSSTPAQPSTGASIPQGDSGGGDSGSDSSSGSDFEFINSVFGDDSSSSEADRSAAPPAGQQPPPAQPGSVGPAEPQAAPPVGTEAAGQQGTEPATQVAQPTPSAPQVDPADPMSIAKWLMDNKEAAIEHLANEVFKMEPKDMEALENDVAGSIPKLLAKAVIFSQSRFLTQMANIVPLMMQTHLEITKRQEENAGEFWKAWPTIDQASHGETVKDLAIRYRRMFPNISTAQMIEQLGPLVQTHLGIPLTPMVRKGSPASAPAAAANGRRSPNQAFAPAAPGSVVSTSQVPEDPFGFLGLQQ